MSATPTTISTATPARAALSWFEIPCQDLDRAQAFYEAVLARPLRREQFGGAPLAVFAYDAPATGGCLIAGPERRVAPDAGVRVYLDCEPALDAAVTRIVAAGGQVLDACIALPEGMGYIAHLRDLEGNTVGLHALAR